MLALPFPEISTTMDWSIILLVFSAIVYYLGRSINEFNPKREEKYLSYTRGVEFLALFVLFPVILVYVRYNNLLDQVGAKIVILLSVQLFWIWYLDKKCIAISIVKKGWGKIVSKQLLDKVRVKISKFGISKNLVSDKFIIFAFEFFYYSSFSNLVLLLSIVINLFISFYIYHQSPGVLIVFTSMLILINLIGNTAYLYGSNKHDWPSITLFLEKDISKHTMENG